MKERAGIIFCALAASDSYASAMPVISTGTGCGSEHAQISLTLNEIIPASTSNISDAVEQKLKNIEQAAKQAGATDSIHSKNYSVSPMGDTGYRLLGNVVFQVDPADKALNVMQPLTQKGYVARVNINSYNNGNCNPASRVD